MGYEQFMLEIAKFYTSLLISEKIDDGKRKVAAANLDIVLGELGLVVGEGIANAKSERQLNLEKRAQISGLTI